MKWRRRLKLTNIKVMDSPSYKSGQTGDTSADSEPTKCKGKKHKQKRSFRFLSLGNSGMSATSASSSKVSNDSGDNLPRISNKLTFAELQDEALARGIAYQFLPNTKTELLNFLVDGSIHLRMTSTWKDVEVLKSRMEADCRRIEDEKRKVESARLELVDPKQCQAILPHHFTNRDNSLLDNTAVSTFMESILDSRFSLPPQQTRRPLRRVATDRSDGEESVGHDAWACGLAACTPTNFFGKDTDKDQDEDGDQNDKEDDESDDEEDNEDHGEEETDIGTNLSQSIITMEETDFDPSHFEPSHIDVLAPPAKPENRKASVWESALFFGDAILTPSPNLNLVAKGSNMKGHTVWASLCSQGQIFPTKHFDTTYLALGDANDRARYLFYWKNPWNLAPEKMVETVCIMADNSARDDCPNTFHCAHPNGEKWSVSVVYDSTFKYLDNASMDRRDFYLEPKKGETDDINCP